MSTKTFKCGPFACKAYKKPVGNGYEVGFTMAGQPVFVGNFIHAKEASAWWTRMNAEVKKFSKKYGPPPKAPLGWYSKFLSNFIYKAYYNYLDQEFSKYHRGYTQAVKQGERRFTHWKKTVPPHHFHHTAQRRAA